MKQKISLTTLLFSAIVFLASFVIGGGEKPAVVDRDTLARSAGKGLQILQKSGYRFMEAGHCISCHHNILTAVAEEIARRKGIPVIDSLSVQWTMGMEGGINAVFNDNKINEFIAAKFIGAYVLLGLGAEKYPADASTDLVLNYLLNQARPDGSFGTEAMRVPLESGEIHLAALAIKGIMQYAPPSKMDRVREAVNRTRQFLEKADPDNQQEIAFQLMGLQWTNADAAKKSAVGGRLISLQNPDGGWSQLPGISSDAYATGQALYALSESGQVKPEDEPYQKGLRYLLKTQDDAGAWAVVTRSYPIQPFISSDFPPYDENQFISAAGSSWAVMALLNALPEK